jgi:hypothetical protein
VPNQQDPFSGTWKINPEKSSFDPNHRPSAATIHFEHESDGYLMRAEGSCDGKHVEEQPQRFILDGKEHPVPGVPGVTTVSTRPDPNTLHASARNGDRVLGEASYVVSTDRATLTATVNGIDAKQRRFQSTLVWDRQ